MIEDQEIERRVKTAFTAIRESFADGDDEFGVPLFVSHHLKELEGSYWESHLQSSSPEPSKVLDILVVSPDWSPEEDGIDDIDFTLPDGVTNYVICVSFNEDGEVEDISMES